ncbi:nuclear transport factor 2 family protein [Ferrovibrio xuzhouensis]|uniref:Nuclear transport factor 2 family protein n=1 Tax=Ferrovibrio xuzhouensis TaxID=1576914 RepID=A0ABV7VHL9_9PROT
MTAAPQDGRDAVGEGLDRYLRFLAGLTPETLDGLDGLVCDDVHFRDPFSDVRGRAAMKTIFAAMYRDCTDVAFVIDGVLRQDAMAMVKWSFRFRPKRFGGAQPWTAIGVSELHLAPDGRIAAHLDYWDAGSQFYARLPLLGPLVRFVRRRLQHH